LFYTVTTWALSYGIAKRPPDGAGLGFSFTGFLHLQLISVLFFAALIPVAGWLADRFGRRRTLLVTTAAIIVYGASFGALLAPERATQTSTLVFLIIGMTLMGLTFGPMSAASILGAAVAPFIAAWLATSYGAI